MEASSGKKRSFVSGGIALVVGVVLVFAVGAAMADGRAVLDAWQSFSGGAVLLGACLVLGNYALRFLRWDLYLREVQVRVPLGLNALIFTAGFVMSISPGKLGEVIKSALLYRHRGVAVERTAPIVLAERLMDLVALVLLVALTSSALEGGIVIAGAAGLVVAGIFAACFSRGLVEWGIGLLERFPLGQRMAPRLRDAYASLRALTAPRPLAFGAVIGTLGWSLECLATWVVLQGFEDVAVPLWSAAFSYAAGTLAGALAMLPGGLGVTEAGMAGLLVATHRGLDPEVALVATLLVRLITLWFGVALGGISLLVLRLVAKPEPV